MSEEIMEFKKIQSEASRLKTLILKNNNIDILLYLAKYNPGVALEKIASKFGKNTLEDIRELERHNLLREDQNKVSLTNEGIFQVEGLLTLSV